MVVSEARPWQRHWGRGSRCYIGAEGGWWRWCKGSAVGARIGGLEDEGVNDANRGHTVDLVQQSIGDSDLLRITERPWTAEILTSLFFSSSSVESTMHTLFLFPNSSLKFFSHALYICRYGCIVVEPVLSPFL